MFISKRVFLSILAQEAWYEKNFRATDVIYLALCVLIDRQT